MTFNLHALNITLKTPSVKHFFKKFFRLTFFAGAAAAPRHVKSFLQIILFCNIYINSYSLPILKSR
tara:strand:- start:541 stop:738 length:198 start_codon:yes stop_codon:yes gene_type:complete